MNLGVAVFLGLALIALSLFLSAGLLSSRIAFVGSAIHEIKRHAFPRNRDNVCLWTQLLERVKSRMDRGTM